MTAGIGAAVFFFWSEVPVFDRELHGAIEGRIEEHVFILIIGIFGVIESRYGCGDSGYHTGCS